MKIFVILILLALTGCGEERVYHESELRDLYSEAHQSFLEGSYKSAADTFDEVDKQYPYSPWSLHAQLMSSYCSYLGGHLPRAISNLGTLIKLHPSYPHIEYARYLRALCYYASILRVEKDQEDTLKCYEAFSELLRLHPNSKYAADATSKMSGIREHLANKQMFLGRYYAKHRTYPAAIRQFDEVIKNFNDTTHIPEAMFRLAESYHALGLHDEAKQILVVMREEFPRSDWAGREPSLR